MQNLSERNENQDLRKSQGQSPLAMSKAWKIVCLKLGFADTVWCKNGSTILNALQTRLIQAICSALLLGQLVEVGLRSKSCIWHASISLPGGIGGNLGFKGCARVSIPR